MFCRFSNQILQKSRIFFCFLFISDNDTGRELVNESLCFKQEKREICPFPSFSIQFRLKALKKKMSKKNILMEDENKKSIRA